MARTYRREERLRLRRRKGRGPSIIELAHLARYALTLGVENAQGKGERGLAIRQARKARSA